MGERKPQLRAAVRVRGALTWFLLVTGTVLVGFYVLARMHSLVMSQLALGQFSKMEKADPALADTAGVAPSASHQVSFHLWSLKRITAYQDSLKQHFAPPLAVLEIPKIDLEAPVFDGTDDLTLNRGVGRIVGTAHPGEGGNVGIAGHRDGFFRGLKDVVVGDRIELRTLKRTETYRVSNIQITSPTDIRVLADQGVPSLTLVTCYPFYFIGNAPRRYIVRAVISDENLGGKASVQPNPAIGTSRNQERTK